MKKWQVYVILFITAIVNVACLGFLKEMFTGGIEISVVSISLVLLFVALSAILIYHLKRIKFDVENSHLLENAVAFKISIIGLLVLAIFITFGQIIGQFMMLSSGFSMSPIPFVIMGVSAIYGYFLLRLFMTFKNPQNPSSVSSTKKFNARSININQFRYSGELSTDLYESDFKENSEFLIDRKTYENYRPVLTSKKYDTSGNIYLYFSNREDLGFTVYIKEYTTVYTQFNTKNKQENLIEEEIYKTLETMAMSRKAPSEILESAD